MGRDGQTHPKQRPSARPIVHAHLAAVAVHDVAAHKQAETRSFPDGFCGDEGLENSLALSERHAGPAVGNFDHHLLVERVGTDMDFAL